MHKTYFPKVLSFVCWRFNLTHHLCLNDKLTETSTIIAPEGIKSNVTREQNLLLYFVRKISSKHLQKFFYVKLQHILFFMKQNFLNWDNIFCLVEIKNYNLAIFVLFPIFNLSKYLRKNVCFYLFNKQINLYVIISFIFGHCRCFYFEYYLNDE